MNVLDELMKTLYCKTFCLLKLDTTVHVRVYVVTTDTPKRHLKGSKDNTSSKRIQNCNTELQ